MERKTEGENLEEWNLALKSLTSQTELSHFLWIWSRGRLRSSKLSIWDPYFILLARSLEIHSAFDRIHKSKSLNKPWRQLKTGTSVCKFGFLETLVCVCVFVCKDPFSKLNLIFRLNGIRVDFTISVLQHHPLCLLKPHKVCYRTGWKNSTSPLHPNAKLCPTPGSAHIPQVPLLVSFQTSPGELMGSPSCPITPSLQLEHRASHQWGETHRRSGRVLGEPFISLSSSSAGHRATSAPPSTATVPSWSELNTNQCLSCSPSVKP